MQGENIKTKNVKVTRMITNVPLLLYRNLFEDMLKFHGSRHATSVNLMTVMGSIVLIARLRPSFMGKVVTAMEKLNGILYTIEFNIV